MVGYGRIPMGEERPSLKMLAKLPQKTRLIDIVETATLSIGFAE